MEPDGALIARVREKIRPHNQHDLNNALAVYIGLVELQDPSVAARIAAVELRLKWVAVFGTLPKALPAPRS